MSKKKLSDKMLKEIVNNLPKPLVDYWIKNPNKSIDSLQIYTKGFCEGVNFVIETILKPHIDRIDKILNQ